MRRRIPATIFLSVIAAMALALSCPPRFASAATYSIAWTSTASNAGRAISWGDFDNDGFLDLLTANSGEATRVWSGNGSGTFASAWSSTQTEDTQDAAFGDFDGDGDLDIATANAGGANRVYRYDGANTFTLVWSSTETDFTQSVDWGDYDGDGDLDILAGNYGSQSRIYRNDGGGTFTLVWSSGVAYQTEDAKWSDIDNDGDLDIALGNYSQANIVFRNDSGSFSIIWTSTETEATRAIAWGDYNGDGFPDLLCANLSQVKRLYRNDGGTGFTSVWTSTETDATEDADWGDFDNDGDLDMLIGNNGQANRIYRNNGGGAFALDWSSTETDATYGIAWGDYDNDGDLDQAVGNTPISYNRVYANAPATANSAPTAPTVTAEPDAPPGNITLQWTASTDTQTTNASLLTYDLRVGTSAGGCQVFCGKISSSSAAAGAGNVLVGSTHTLSFATGTYYWSSRAVDSAWRRGSWSAADTFVIDGSPPTTSTISDGTGADIDYTSSGAQLSANWTASTEAQSTLVRYWYSIGTSPYASDTVSWTDNALTTSVTKTGLSLTNGGTYYVTVKAENSAGLFSNLATTDGQMSDTTAPAAISSVYDGDATDIDYSTSGTTIKANWPATTDTQSGVAAYWYSIGTSSGASDTVSWTSNGTNRSISHGSLSLTDGTTYFVSVKAINNSGLFSGITTSDGQLVDTTVPTVGSASVKDGPYNDVSHASTTSQLTANWTGFADPHSGLARYYYGIGTTAGTTGVSGGWIDIATATNVTKTGLSLTDGQTYYFTVIAQNNAGLDSPQVNSNGQLYDSSAPTTTSASVLDGPDVDVSYATSSTTLIANWSGFADTHSGISKYWYAIGTTSGNTDISGWTDNGASTSVTRAGLTLTDGQSYYFSVKAENQAQVVSGAVNSNGQLVDTSQPGAPASVSDSIGADIDYSSSTTSLSSIWSAATDVHSGIKKYWYAIGTTSGGTDVTSGWVDNGAATSFTRAGTYSNGTTYFVSVKAENNAGLLGTATVSDGVLIDTSAPADVAAVSDGTGADASYTNDNAQLSANWAASSDAQSGVLRYWYSIGTSAGASNTVSWTNNGLSTSVTRTGLGLSNGQLYYFTVKAENTAGLFSNPVSSNGILVDVSAPDVVFVLDGTTSSDIDYTSSGTQLSANWTDSADTQSGVLKYWYSIGTSAGASNTVSWTDNGTATSVTRTGLTLTDGVTYYFSISAENNSHVLSAPVSSDGQMSDTTPPADIATANDGTGADIDFTTSTTLSANWSASSDPHSGVLRYWYSIGTTSGASDSLAWTDNGASTAASYPATSLPDGQTLYFNIKAENNSNLFSAIISTDGILKDSSPPTTISYVYDGTAADISYSTDTSHLSANWAASSDPDSGIVRYWYSAGTSSGASDTVPWTDNGLSTSTSLSSLSLTDGVDYYFTVKAESAVGLMSTPTSSNGVRIDSSNPPPVSQVKDGTGQDISITMTGDRLSANWTASLETHSPISAYPYSIGTSPGATDIVNWTDAPSTSVTKTGLALADTTTYYFNVKARNAAGLESTVTSSNGAIYNEAAPVTTFSNPSSSQTVTGTVQVTGRIYDFSLQSWTLSLGPGASPSSWTVIASGTTNIENALISDWNTSALCGQYTLLLSATDTIGANTTERVTVTAGNGGSATGTIPAGTPVMLSVPLQISNATPESVFGTGREYKVLRWDPTASDDTYIQKYRSVSSVEPGKAFWLIAYDSDVPYVATGTPIDTTQTYNIAVKSGWNQIAVPFDIDFNWDNINVKTSTSTHTMSAAVALGLISSSFYDYSTSASSFSLHGAGYRLTARVGYFIRAYADCELVFDPTIALSAPAARILRPRTDYMLRLSAKSAGAADNDNFIGSVLEASPGMDRFDAEEPPLSPAGIFTALSFTGDTSRLASDIRPIGSASSPAETWSFSVRTNDPVSQVTIDWDPATLPADEFTFTLSPPGASAGIDMTAQSSYVFAASSPVTEGFTISVAKTSSRSATASIHLEKGWNLSAAPLDPAETGADAAILGRLPGGSVFQFASNRFFSDASADIQAGIGYWILSPDEIDITVSGTLAPETVAVPISSGWNLLGNPFDTAMPWGDNIKVVSGGTELSLSEAVAFGIIDSNIYTYHNGEYSRLSPGASISVAEGFIVRATAGAKIILEK